MKTSPNCIRKQKVRYRKNYVRYEKSVNLFSDQFRELFPKKIFSAEIRPEIDDIGENIGPKIGQIMEASNGRGGAILRY